MRKSLILKAQINGLNNEFITGNKEEANKAVTIILSGICFLERDQNNSQRFWMEYNTVK